MQSNTAKVGNQPVALVDFLSDQPKAEPFTTRDGHFVGADGFVVPKNFDEFNVRYLQYIRLWVRKHAEKSAQPEDVEDWTQDLLIHTWTTHSVRIL